MAPRTTGTVGCRPTAGAAARLATAVLAAGLGGDGELAGRLMAAAVAAPVALTALPDGGLRYGERLTGRVREIDGSGRLRPEPVVEVDVRTGGQRGLLGLAVDDRDRTFAAWTDPGGMIVVGQVAPGPVRVVWRGPPSAQLGNGGHMELSPDGALVLAIGDLQRDDRSGRLVALDPDGSADQEPRLISSGWNNPYAFAFGPDGSLWVADNAPGEQPERLARLGRDGRATFSVDLPGGQIAPAGLVVLDDRRLVICAYLPARLLVYDTRTGRRHTLAHGCRTGVVRLAGGDLALAGDDELRRVDNPM